MATKVICPSSTPRLKKINAGIRSLVREIAETGAVLMIVGGDHSLSYPNVAGLADVVGFDLVELHPALDPTYRSTQNSVFIMKACITGLAMRKEGLTEKHYLSPVSSEHAIDDYYGDQQKYLDATAAEEAKEKAKEEEMKNKKEEDEQ
jgi:hypothetical protein